MDRRGFLLCAAAAIAVPLEQGHPAPYQWRARMVEQYYLPYAGLELPEEERLICAAIADKEDRAKLYNRWILGADAA